MTMITVMRIPTGTIITTRTACWRQCPVQRDSKAHTDSKRPADAHTASGQDVWVQITRNEADRLGLAPGGQVFLRPVSARRGLVAAMR